MKAKEIGNRGEDTALRYLMKKGYRLLERNHRSGKQEIDLIMADGETIVFVEVKARSSTRFGDPSEYVDRRKQAFLIRAAQAYLMERNGFDSLARFDVVCVYLPEERVEHIQNAFLT